MSQLLECSPSLQWRLHGYLGRHCGLESVAFDELWDHLASALCKLRRICCIADALNEISPGNDWFIEKLAKIGQLKPASVKVFMTSRPLPRIESLLRYENVLKMASSRESFIPNT